MKWAQIDNVFSHNKHSLIFCYQASTEPSIVQVNPLNESINSAELAQQTAPGELNKLKQHGEAHKCNCGAKEKVSEIRKWSRIENFVSHYQRWIVLLLQSPTGLSVGNVNQPNESFKPIETAEQTASRAPAKPNKLLMLKDMQAVHKLDDGTKNKVNSYTGTRTYAYSIHCSCPTFTLFKSIECLEFFSSRVRHFSYAIRKSC